MPDSNPRLEPIDYKSSLKLLLNSIIIVKLKSTFKVREVLFIIIHQAQR